MGACGSKETKEVEVKPKSDSNAKALALPATAFTQESAEAPAPLQSQTSSAVALDEAAEVSQSKPAPPPETAEDSKIKVVRQMTLKDMLKAEEEKAAAPAKAALKAEDSKIKVVRQLTLKEMLKAEEEKAVAAAPAPALTSSSSAEALKLLKKESSKTMAAIQKVATPVKASADESAEMAALRASNATGLHDEFPVAPPSASVIRQPAFAAPTLPDPTLDSPSADALAAGLAAATAASAGVDTTALVLVPATQAAAAGVGGVSLAGWAHEQIVAAERLNLTHAQMLSAMKEAATPDGALTKAAALSTGTALTAYNGAAGADGTLATSTALAPPDALEPSVTPSSIDPSKLHPDAAAALAAFKKIDKNGDGVLSRIEVIQAAKASAEIRALLGLPSTIKQEDGSRDAFEAVFQMIDSDASKSISLYEFITVFGSKAAREKATPKATPQAELPGPEAATPAGATAAFALKLGMLQSAQFPVAGPRSSVTGSLPPWATIEGVMQMPSHLYTAGNAPAPPKLLTEVDVTARLDAEIKALEAKNAELEARLNLQSRPSFKAVMETDSEEAALEKINADLEAKLNLESRPSFKAVMAAPQTEDASDHAAGVLAEEVVTRAINGAMGNANAIELARAEGLAAATKESEVAAAVAGAAIEGALSPTPPPMLRKATSVELQAPVLTTTTSKPIVLTTTTVSAPTAAAAAWVEGEMAKEADREEEAPAPPKKGSEEEDDDENILQKIFKAPFWANLFKPEDEKVKKEEKRPSLVLEAVVSPSKPPPVEEEKPASAELASMVDPELRRRNSTGLGSGLGPEPPPRASKENGDAAPVPPPMLRKKTSVLATEMQAPVLQPTYSKPAIITMGSVTFEASEPSAKANGATLSRLRASQDNLKV